jgi:hypothetical protein
LITLSWIDDDYLLFIEFSGKITDDQVHRWVHTILPIMDSREEMIHTLIELKPDVNFQISNPFKMAELMKLTKHQRTGLTVLVGRTPLFAFWIQTFQHISGMKFRAFPSTAEGKAFLKEVRALDREKDVVSTPLPTLPQPQQDTF